MSDGENRFKRFVRSFLAALGDEATYDFGRNPSLWLGFLTALPTPALALATDMPLWMKALAVTTPFVWAIVLGAAGRVGQLAEERASAIENKAANMEEHLAVTEEALGETLLMRKALEEEKAQALAEMRLAEAVQRSLLPEPVRDRRVQVALRSIPSRLIGGDYVQVTLADERHLYVMVADVSGHGISAALVVARLHGVVRRLTLTAISPENMIAALNKAALAICKHTYFFVTCAIGRLDLVTGVFDYSTAGHPAQILLRAGGQIERLRTRNRLLGMDDDVFDTEAPSGTLQLHAGDTLVFFTDGVFEILRDGHGDVLGDDGLEARIGLLGPLEPQLLLGELLHDLSDFQGRTTFDDDLTLLLVRYLGA